MSNEDWQVGDLAMCILADPDSVRPAKGTFHTVAEVIHYPHATGLQFDDCRVEEDDLRYAGFDARCFRKIRPHEADEEDRETIHLMQRDPKVLT